MVYVSGFIGTVSYDLIHYLSRVARAFKKKSLIIDCSDSMATSYTVRTPIVPPGERVDYRGVDFIGFPDDLDMVEEYDYVFIDFGFEVGHPYVDECDGIYVVTDHQLQNVMRLKDLEFDEDQDLSLIVRDDVGSKFSVSSVCRMLGELQFDPDRVFSIMQSDQNTLAALSVQYDSIFKFNRVTDDVRDIIIDFYSMDFKEAEVRKAFVKASRAR